MAAMSVDDDMMSGVGPLSSVPTSPATPHFSSPTQHKHGRGQQKPAESPITTISVSPSLTAVSAATSQTAPYPHVDSFPSSSQTSSTFIREMEGVRNSLQHMLKLGQAMAERDSCDGVEGLGLLTADSLGRKDADESFDSTTTTALLTAKPVLVSQEVSPVSVDSGLHTTRGQWSSRMDTEPASERRSSRSESLYVENQILRDSVERERFRRKHCEQQIQELQSKILELQQQLAVAVSTDKKKDVMIEQLDKTLAKVVEGWKKQDTEKTELIRRLKEEKVAIEKGHSRQQEVLVNFEKDLAQAVEQLAIEQQKASMAEQEKVSQFQQQQEEKAQTLALLQIERERAVRVEAERDQLLQQRDMLQGEVHSFNQQLETEMSAFRTREEELSKQLDVLTEKHQEVLDQEKAIAQAESQKAQEHQKALSEAQGELSQLKMELGAANRDKENLKMELSLQEAKFEASQSKLQSEYQAEQERKISQQLAEAHAQLTETEERLREGHRRQVQEMADTHRHDLDKQLQQFHLELQHKEARLRDTCQDYDDRLSEAREKISTMSRENNKLESQKNSMKARLQALIQAHVKEAMLLLSDVTADILPGATQPAVSSTFLQGMESVNNTTTVGSGMGMRPSMFSMSAHPSLLDTAAPSHGSVPWSTQKQSDTGDVSRETVMVSGQHESQGLNHVALINPTDPERLNAQRQDEVGTFAALTVDNLPLGKRQPTAEVHRHTTAPGERQPTAEVHRHTTALGERQPIAEVHRHTTALGERQPTAEVHRHTTALGERQATAEVHRHTTALGERQATAEVHRHTTALGERQPTAEVHRHTTAPGESVPHVSWSPETVTIAETVGYTEQDIDDEASILSVEPARRMVESQYEPLLEKFHHHESKQTELQHYVQLLLQRSPGGRGPVLPSQEQPGQEHTSPTGPSSLAFLPPEAVDSPPTSARTQQVDLQAVLPSSLEYTNQHVPQQSVPADVPLPNVPDKEPAGPQPLHSPPSLSTDKQAQLWKPGQLSSFKLNSMVPGAHPLQTDVHGEAGPHLNLSSQNLVSRNVPVPVVRSRLPLSQSGPGVSHSYPPMMASSPKVLPVSASHRGTPSKDVHPGAAVVTRVVPAGGEGQLAGVVQRIKVPAPAGLSQLAARKNPAGASDPVALQHPVWPTDPAVVQELLDMYTSRSGQGHLSAHITGHHASSVVPPQPSAMFSSRDPARVKRSLSASFSQTEPTQPEAESRNAKTQSASKVPPRTTRVGRTQVVKPTQARKPDRKVAGGKGDKKVASAWR